MKWFARRKPDIYLARATSEDTDDLADLHAGSFSRPWSEHEFDGMLATRGTSAWIARQRGGGASAPLGFVLVRVAGDEAEIISIATRPRSRRKGVARALMDHVIREMHGERVGRLLLEVDARNQAALFLYRSLGFRQIATRQGYYRNPQGQEAGGGKAAGSAQTTSDALVMELDLR